MANRPPRSSNPVRSSDKGIPPFQFGTPIPLLDETEYDGDASWTPCHDSGHVMGDSESSTEEMRFSVK